MLKIGFFVFVTLSLWCSFDISIRESKLERFWSIYSKWASEHPEYECSIYPEMQVVHSTFRLWQVKQESGRVDSVLKMMSDSPISHEVYIYLDDYGRKVTYFPEINRVILSCFDKKLDSKVETNSLVISALFGNFKLVKRFLIFEKLSETNEGVVFDMIVDVKKMKSAGLVSEQVDVSEIRLVFSLKESGELVRMSRQFDDGDLEVLYFDYISFFPDEVRESFPNIGSLRSRSISSDFTYKDALEEIERMRQHSEPLGR